MNHKRSRVLRQRLVGTVMAGALLLGGVSVAHGVALTTPGCLAKKLKEWGKLRKCQALENGTVLQGKPADPAKCQTKLNDKLAKISAQATAAAIACRCRDNGDGTVRWGEAMLNAFPALLEVGTHQVAER